MSLIVHLVRTELRVARPLIMIILVLQLLHLASFLGWMGLPSGDFDSPALGPMIIDSMFSYAGLGFLSPLVLMVLVSNSPVISENFVATRPLKRRDLAIAKVIALWLIMVGPFVFVELIHLTMVGMPKSDVVLGVVQTGVWITVLQLLLVAITWLFRSKREAGIGIATIIFGAIATLFLGGFLMYLRWPQYSAGAAENVFQSSFSTFRVFVGFVILAILAWVILVFHWKRGCAAFGRRLGLLMVSIVTVLIGLWFVPSRKPGVERVEAPALVTTWITSTKTNSGDDSHSLSFEPGQDSPAGLYSEAWEVASVSLGGKKVSLPPQPTPQQDLERWIPWTGEQFVETADLKASLVSNPVCLPNTIAHNSRSSASVILSDEWVGKGDQKVEATLVRHRFEWEKIAELELKQGEQSGAWTLDIWESIWEDQNEIGALNLGLSERAMEFWIKGDAPLANPRVLRFLLVDDEHGICLPAEQVSEKMKIGAHSAMSWQGVRVKFRGEQFFAMKLDPARCRVLIFSPEWSSSSQIEWSGVAKQRKIGRNPGLARESKNLSIEDFTKWIEKNPAPDGDVPDLEVARYLVSLLEKTNHLERRIREDHPVVDQLTMLVPEHLPMFVRAHHELAMDQHASLEVIEMAIASGIDRRMFAENLEVLMRMSSVRGVARSKAWFDGLERDLAEGARAGNRTMFHEAIRLPNQAGLSAEECLMIFWRQPHVATYNLLKIVDGLRLPLDEEIDLWLRSSLRQVSDSGSSIDPALTLALGTGHPDAPALFQEVLRRVVPEGENGIGFQFLWHRHFDSDNRGDDAGIWLQEFLKTDPEAYVFDEKSGRYKLTKTSEN